MPPRPGVKKKNWYATAITFPVYLFLYGLLSFIYRVGAVIYCGYYYYFAAVIAYAYASFLTGLPIMYRVAVTCLEYLVYGLQFP